MSVDKEAMKDAIIIIHNIINYSGGGNLNLLGGGDPRTPSN